GGRGEQIPIVAGALAQYEGLAQWIRVVITHRADRDKSVERAQRRRLAHLAVRAAERELLELHGELDVGQRATPELEMELRVFARRNALALDARLHAPHVAPPLRGERIAVHELLGEVDEPRAELGIARDHARLRQRLEFPRLRPLLEVRTVTAQRTGQWALVALGPQSRVDAEGSALRGAVADRADEPGRRSLRD